MKKLIIGLLLSIILITFIINIANYRPKCNAISQYLLRDNFTVDKDELFVQFLGNTNILLSDGKHSILTDGFFTRPSITTLLWGELSPDHEVIQQCLDEAGISKLDAVIPVHSHFDHAMDAPIVAQLTNAKLVGSSSTANVGRGQAFPEARIIIPTLNETFEIGDFKITMANSRHWQYPDPELRALYLDQSIDTVLTTPAPMEAYKEGISYTIFIQHHDYKIAIQGSAGFRDGALEAVDAQADLLFLSIAGLEMMDETYNKNYQELLIDKINPKVLVPIHWDDFTVPLKDGLKTTSLIFNYLQNADLEKAFDIVGKNNILKGRQLKVLPLWKKVPVKELLE